MQKIQISASTAADRRIPFKMVDDTDGKTGETGLTFSAGDIKISKNGGAESNHSGSVTEIANGKYYYEATAGEVDTRGFLSVEFIKSGSRTFSAIVQIVSYNPYDSAYLGLTGIDDLETRLSAARAGYLDNLSAGAVAQASVCTEARLSELAAANIPADVDTLLSRLSSLRAGYLDNLSAGAVALASVCTSARLGELDAANLPTDINNVYTRIGAPAGASIAADLVVIDNFVDDLETRLSAARAGYLDNLSAGAVALASVCTSARLGELDAANIPADIDTLLSRLTSTRAAYLEELGPTNIPADVDTLISRLTSLRAGYLDNLSAGAVATASALATVSGLVDDLEGRLTALRAGYLDNLSGGPVALASGVVVSDKTGFSLSSTGIDDIFAKVIEGTETFIELMRILRAATVGVSDGGGTGTRHFRDMANTKPRVTGTMDANGNRTAVTVDGA